MRARGRVVGGLAALLVVLASARCERIPALRAADVPVHAPFARGADPVERRFEVDFGFELVFPGTAIP